MEHSYASAALDGGIPDRRHVFDSDNPISWSHVQKMTSGRNAERNLKGIQFEGISISSLSMVSN